VQNFCTKLELFLLLAAESKVWHKVKVEGDALVARGAHTLVAVDNHIVLYGGSADFRPNVGHCTRYFSDIYVLKTGELIFLNGEICNRCLWFAVFTVTM